MAGSIFRMDQVDLLLQGTLLGVFVASNINAFKWKLEFLKTCTQYSKSFFFNYEISQDSNQCDFKNILEGKCQHSKNLHNSRIQVFQRPRNHVKKSCIGKKKTTCKVLGKSMDFNKTVQKDYWHASDLCVCVIKKEYPCLFEKVIIILLFLQHIPVSLNFLPIFQPKHHVATDWIKSWH